MNMIRHSGSSSNSSSSSGSNSNSSCDSSGSHSDSRMTVADILSSMAASTLANGEVVTPSSFATLDGYTTGIPTRTTPTLTPTTLRNIEQTFIELQSVPPPTNHHHQAGFVPPVVNAVSSTAVVTAAAAAAAAAAITTTTNSSISNSTAFQTNNIKEESIWYSTGMPSVKLTSTTSTSSARPTKASGRMGGRRPNRDERLSPEEEERRRIRRERNKLAAARCRKRRLDHTNSLLSETDGLEERRQELQKEIGLLQSQKEQLEFVLEAHRCLCKGNGVGKINGVSNQNNPKESIEVPTSSMSPPLSIAATSVSTSVYSSIDSKPLARPTTLQLPSNFTVPSSTSIRLNTSVSVSEIAGVPISTPSNGMFNFDALMEGGTGLTPTLTPMIPTCSSQQRSSNNDLVSPDNINPPKLVSL